MTNKFVKQIGMTYFIKNLTFLRKKHNLTQGELADKLGVKRNTISNYENNVSVPDINVLCILVKEFNVSCDAFLFEDLTDKEMNTAEVAKFYQDEEIKKLSSDVAEMVKSLGQVSQKVNKLVKNDKVNSESISEHKKYIFDLKAKINKMEKEMKGEPKTKSDKNKG